MAKSVANVGYALMTMGEETAALPLLEEARATWKNLGNRTELADSTAALGQIHQRIGDLQQSTRFYREALAIFHQAGNLPNIAGVLEGLAGLASLQGRHERAVRISGAAEALKEEIGGRIPMAAVLFEDVTPAARAAMGDEAVETALVQGRTMTVKQAVDYALQDES
jgi:non-specific serine/threonine protein kinase